MTNKQSAILPFLRSETQGRLLAAILLHPGREETLSHLAREIGASAGNLHADVGRLVEAGILADRRIGRSRMISDAGSRYSAALTDLMLLAYGPKPLLEEALAGVAGIEQALIFGSWAARYSGERGTPPNDIDVLVIGHPERDEVFEAAESVGRRLGQEVNVVQRTPESWRDDDSGFARQVRDRPSVTLDLHPASG